MIRKNYFSFDDFKRFLCLFFRMIRENCFSFNAFNESIFLFEDINNHE